ncbi:hypothetical protein WA026_008877 [Henosepilachna vigintioctopunctata]|uniref:Uncharacterized protein n=1 Tax=Henosepilachna vigintioctopunctata TaxID=420089 RepID=A0AAW1V9G7_9CUCU
MSNDCQRILFGHFQGFVARYPELHSQCQSTTLPLRQLNCVIKKHMTLLLAFCRYVIAKIFMNFQDLTPSPKINVTVFPLCTAQRSLRLINDEEVEIYGGWLYRDLSLDYEVGG